MFLEVVKGRVIWRQHCPSHDMCKEDVYSKILKRYCECNWRISLLHLDLGMYGMPASRMHGDAHFVKIYNRSDKIIIK